MFYSKWRKFLKLEKEEDAKRKLTMPRTKAPAKREVETVVDEGEEKQKETPLSTPTKKKKLVKKSSNEKKRKIEEEKEEEEDAAKVA